MVYAVCYDNEIRLWWDKREEKTQDMKYRICVNNKFCVYTDKVYYNFKNLKEGTAFGFEVQLIDKKKNVIGTSQSIIANTLVKKEIIDITKSPYNAIGDGFTDDTGIIKKALSELDYDKKLYLPMGVYLCDKLSFTGNLNLRLDAGAIICTKKTSLEL